MSIFPVMITLGALAAGILSASAPTPAKAAKAAKASPQTRPLNDEALAAAIRARFAKSKISVENFQVRVEAGVAFIDGTTSVIQRKGTATRLARLAGAKQVKNRIQVPESARAKAKENLAQGRRRAQVKRDER